ncbi:MAG TPA: hypothetical protein VE990_03020 [Acidimicrobiales bacterium]|nr:hypothetical protein [Acidimicrobiales bacterium]
MSAERYVVLGLARPRSPWFARVSRWSTAGSLPVDFVKCVSPEELEARLGSGRAVSAVMVDDGLFGADRDLLGVARGQGAATVVVSAGSPRRDWATLGASVVLSEDFDHQRLAEVLRQHARPVGQSGPDPDPSVGGSASGRVVAVCGPGGTGASTVAAVLAQGLARSGSAGSVLVDMGVPGEQAMLHGASDDVPGLLHLVEGHRRGALDRAAVLSHLWWVEERGYHLATGLRRSRSWPALRPRAVEATIETLAQTFAVVVCDVEAELDGERETGSVELEERHAMSRAAVLSAVAVVVVAGPGMKGAHSLGRVVAELVDFGVEPDRILAVVNRVPRGRRSWPETRAAARSLLPAAVPSPVLVPDRGLEQVWRDGRRFPAWLADPLCERVGPMLGASPPSPAAPVPIRPGTVGAVSAADGVAAG